MALTNWNDILNKPNGIDEVPEIALTVEQLSASVLSISEDVGEIALDVSQLSVSVLSIGGDVEQLKEKKIVSSNILQQLDITATDTSYVCNWKNYDLLIISQVYYGNILANVTVSTDYFASTSSDRKITVEASASGGGIRALSVYKDDDTHIKASITSPSSVIGINIYGVKLG